MFPVNETQYSPLKFLIFLAVETSFVSDKSEPEYAFTSYAQTSLSPDFASLKNTLVTFSVFTCAVTAFSSKYGTELSVSLFAGAYFVFLFNVPIAGISHAEPIVFPAR